MFIIGLIVGLIVGACFGLIIFALCASAHSADAYLEFSEIYTCWRSVVTQLPDIGTDVVMRYEYPQGFAGICLGTYIGDGYWHRDGDWRSLVVPTEFISHWMNIPTIAEINKETNVAI
jgi:hypothetical protein